MVVLRRINESVSDKEQVREKLTYVQSVFKDVKKQCLETVKKLNLIPEMKRLKRPTLFNPSYKDSIFDHLAGLESSLNVWIKEDMLTAIDSFMSDIKLNRKHIKMERELFNDRLNQKDLNNMNNVLDQLDAKYVALEKAVNDYKNLVSHVVP